MRFDFAFASLDLQTIQVQWFDENKNKKKALNMYKHGNNSNI